ncbi:hypothetical protein ABT256_31515 [Amycolatopsis japonica]|uniref:hypothetical protein n=1 Tax=Amycolatopsis japonica TaxID=208439 RepID=UPI0033326418
MGVARTGNNNGWLFADNGWSAMRTAKSLSGFPSNRSNCAAAIHADPVGGGANVGLEIWDPDGWRKISHTVKWIDDWAADLSAFAWTTRSSGASTERTRCLAAVSIGA